MSRATHKSRVSEKGTEYPPLPMSVQGETNIWSPTSQTSRLPKSHSRAPSKPPSVSPSDSPSQARYKSPTRSPGPKLKSIPSEDGAGAESPKRGNGNGESLTGTNVSLVLMTGLQSPSICSPLASKQTVLALQACPNHWGYVCYRSRTHNIAY
jgi:hypothetical protein